MHTLLQKNLLAYCMSLVCLFSLFTAAQATEKAGYAGWENDSAYNNHYNSKERDTLKGEIVQFKEVRPLPAMDPGTAFILEEGGDKILVHLCPVAFRDVNETGIRKGIKTKVSGSWAVIDGEDVFMAAKVKQGDNFVLKVRLTKNGYPFWNMSAEELAKESSSD